MWTCGRPGRLPPRSESSGHRRDVTPAPRSARPGPRKVQGRHRPRSRPRQARAVEPGLALAVLAQKPLADRRRSLAGSLVSRPRASQSTCSRRLSGSASTSRAVSRSSPLTRACSSASGIGQMRDNARGELDEAQALIARPSLPLLSRRGRLLRAARARATGAGRCRAGVSSRVICVTRLSSPWRQSNTSTASERGRRPRRGVLRRGVRATDG